MNIVDLVELKNVLYKRFINLTKSGIKICLEGKFEKIPRLIDARERLLKQLLDADLEIEKLLTQTKNLSALETQALRVLYKEKDEMMKEIMGLDEELNKLINDKKNKISHELKNLQRAKKILKGYKSFGKNVE